MKSGETEASFVERSAKRGVRRERVYAREDRACGPVKVGGRGREEVLAGVLREGRLGGKRDTVGRKATYSCVEKLAWLGYHSSFHLCDWA